MINPVNLNNPGNNSNADSALPTGNGTNPANVNNAAFESSILQAADAARQGGSGHHHGGGNEANQMNGIANLGMINPPANNNSNTTNTNAGTISQIQTNTIESTLDTLA